MRIVRCIGVGRCIGQLIEAVGFELIAVARGGFRHDRGSRVDLLRSHGGIHVKNQADDGKSFRYFGRTDVPYDIIRINFVKWIDQYLQIKQRSITHS